MKTVVTQNELAKQVDDLSNVTNGPDKYVVRAISLQIQSNGRLEEAIQRFEESTASTEKDMRTLAKSQVRLAQAQVFLAAVAIIAGILVGFWPIIKR